MHTIRLRGPWEEQPLAGGLVRYVRRFHRPTGLEGGERVWLAIDIAAAELAINEVALGPTPGRFDITDLLEAVSTLALSAAPGLATASLARLEIGTRG